jgi:hypothetical protein
VAKSLLGNCPSASSVDPWADGLGLFPGTQAFKCLQRADKADVLGVAPIFRPVRYGHYSSVDLLESAAKRTSVTARFGTVRSKTLKTGVGSKS